MAKKKKDNLKVEPEVEDNGDQEYQVEVILGARVSDQGEWEYNIRWKGFYEEGDDTWEPAENIEKNCSKLLQSFWKNVGMDNEDYEEGYVCTPTDEWIELETKKFWDDENKRKGKASRTKKQKRSIPVRRRESESPPVASTSKGKKPVVVKREPSEDDTAILSPRKRKRSVVVVSDDEPDEPPTKRRSSRVAAKQPKARAKTRTRRNRKEDNAKKEQGGTHRAISPTDSLFSGPEEPNLSSSPSHVVAAPSQPQPSEPSVQQHSRPTDLKVSIPNGEPSVSSASAKPDDSARSTTNTPNVPSFKLPDFLQRLSPVAPPVSGSGLSTKSRLGQEAMIPVPTNPKNATNPSGSLSAKAPLSAATRKSALNNLAFKKKTITVQASPTITSEDLRPRIPTYTSPDRSPEVTPSTPSFATGPASPVSANITRVSSSASDPTMAALNAAPPSPPFPHMADLSISSPSAFMPPSTPRAVQMSPRLNEAETFLQTMMPPEMAAPFQNVPAEKDDDAMSLPVRTTLVEKPIITGNVERKWKWTGEIAIHVAGGDDQRQVLCDACITDLVQLVQGGMPFRVVLPDDTKSLTFQTFLPVDHLEDVLMACKPEAVARLIPKDEKSDRVRRFDGYLRHNRQVAISPVTLDGIHTANIVCMPSSALHRIERNVKVPSELTDTGLVVILFSWVLSREQQLNSDWHDFIHDHDRPEVEYPVSDPRLLKNPEVKCTIGILGYPQWLHDWLRPKEYQRSYSIWSGAQALETNATMELEINLLQSILGKYESTRSAPIDIEEPTGRVIFIHAQALDTVSRMPHLRKRRETVETMFVVFGTLPTNVLQAEYPSGFWEIYPIGGVMTFTARALLQHPDVILDKTRDVAEYDLWSCYIIPTVLGMAVTLFYQDEDPLEAFDRDNFAYQFLLDAIHEGEIGLLRCPPPVPNVTTVHWMSTDEHGQPLVFERLRKDDEKEDWRDARSEWFSDQADSLFRDQRETLEFCLREFKRAYANVLPSQWGSVLVKEIADDMRNMQVQPGIATEYRRFVVLKEEGEKDSNDELEWISPESFEVYSESGTPPPDSPVVTCP